MSVSCAFSIRDLLATFRVFPEVFRAWDRPSAVRRLGAPFFAVAFFPAVFFAGVFLAAVFFNERFVPAFFAVLPRDFFAAFFFAAVRFFAVVALAIVASRDRALLSRTIFEGALLFLPAQ